MANAAKPVSTGQRLKAAREAAKKRREDEKANLVAENVRLKAELAARPAVLSNSDPIPVSFSFVKETDGKKPKPVELPNEQFVKDDLDWIDESVHAVAIVAKNMTITLRPYNTRVFPPIESVAVHSSYSGPWPANPFDLRSNLPDVDARARKEKFNSVVYANWGHFRITRELAKDVYGDPRHPVPQKAVISAAEFKGYDREVHRPVGTFRDLGPNPDPLRECVRNLLQRMEFVFIDAAHHGPQILAGFDPRRPNPYRMRLGNLSAKLPPVAQEGATK